MVETTIEATKLPIKVHHVAHNISPKGGELCPTEIEPWVL